MKRTLLVDDDMLDRIIINDLKDAYYMNYCPNNFDCADDYTPADLKLLSSIKTVLSYYMTSQEYKDWIKTCDQHTHSSSL